MSARRHINIGAGLKLNGGDLNTPSEVLLLQTQASLAAIIENSSATIFSLDREFRYINFNTLLKNTLKRIYGVDIKLGDVVFDFLYKDDPDQADEWRGIYTRALEGESMQFVKEFSVGEYHSFIKFYINPIVQGSFVSGLSCMSIDITAERTAELAMSNSEAKFRALIENNLDAIMVRDVDKNLIYVSPSVSRMIGRSDAETSEVRATEILVHPDDVQQLRELYEETAKLPGVPLPATLRIRHKVGHYIWIEGTMTNMLNIPNVNGYVFNFRDITERKVLEIENEKISKDLMQRNEGLEQYAYIVSHNLRSPVANLLGLVNLLEMPTVSQGDFEKAISHIVSSVHRLDDVIKDLSSILQTREEVHMHRETVRFQEVANNVCASIDHILVEKNVIIETDFECSSIISIKPYVYSIFYNLISNGIKYCKPDTTPIIRIRSKRVGNKVLLVFEDNGLGMDLPLYGDKVFGLYARFHGGQAEGKGMGLFMVKTQVETLGGKIAVESEIGEGTAFSIEL